MYQCSNPECTKTFLHTAKLTEYSTSADSGIVAKGILDSLDASVCPFCKSKAYTEIAETKGVNLQNISSMIDVNPNEVDPKLAEGYVVLESWQKNIRLVKLKTDETPKETPG